MKIKITSELPVASEVRPRIGGTYEVVGQQPNGNRTMYFIMVGSAQVGVFPNECEKLPEEEAGGDE